MPDKPAAATANSAGPVENSKPKDNAVPSTSNDTSHSHPAAASSSSSGETHAPGSAGSGSGSRHSSGHRKKHHHHHHHHRHHRNHVAGDVAVPLLHDEHSFEARQKKILDELEKQMEEEVKKKKEDWEQEVERMKEEFLHLYPSDRQWGSEDYLDDPLVYRRRGSTDVLDLKKMKTMYLEYPGFGRRFKLRYDVSGYDPETITVSCEGDRIIVKATSKQEDADGKLVDREYMRKIEKPIDVDPEKLKCFLTSDKILIVEAPLPPKSLNIRKTSASPSHSSYSSSRSRSPSNSPLTPKDKAAAPKPGIPQFNGKESIDRKLTLMVDIGNVFKPREITVQVLGPTRLMVKAKHEERTSERFCKSKFCKEYELGEKIEAFSLRAGLTEDGKLLVGALGKGVQVSNKSASLRSLIKDVYGDAGGATSPCNVLDLASFPPTAHE